MVAGDGDEGEAGGHSLLEEVEGVGQEGGVDGRRGGVALDEVAHLQDEAGVAVHQGGRPFHEGGAARLPHVGVAHELFPVVRFPRGIRVRVAGVILFGVRRVIVRVAQDDGGIGAVVRGESLRGASQQGSAHHRAGRILEERSSVHRFGYKAFQVTSSAVPSGETTLKTVSSWPMVTSANFQMTPVGSPVAASSATFSPLRKRVRLGALA